MREEHEGDVEGAEEVSERSERATFNVVVFEVWSGIT